MIENNLKKPHTLVLDNRRALSLTGVEDVSGFDETTISVRLADCSLVVKGAGLHISKLSRDTGEGAIDGTISSLQYMGAAAKSLRSRLFR